VLAVRASAESATTLTWEKRFGGSDFDQLGAMTTDAAGNIYIAGTTRSVDLPTSGVYPAPMGTNIYRTAATTSVLEPLPPAPGGSVLAIGSDASSSGVIYISTSLGVMRTSDEGKTWKMLESLPLHQSGPAPAIVRSIAVDPRNPDVIYLAASAQGLLKSTDGGETWTSPLQGYANVTSMLSVTISQAQPDTIFATGYADSAPLAFRSQDGGQTWIALAPAITQVAADAAAPSTLYGLGPLTSLRSLDNGSAWSELPTPAACVAPQSILAYPVWQPSLYLLCSGSLFRSSDHGDTWELENIPDANGEFLVAQTTDPVLPVLCVASSPGNIYCTTDGGATWTQKAKLGKFPTAIASYGGTMFVGSSRDRDGFAAKFTPQGDLVWATYLGGSGDDAATAIAVDQSGYVYVAGTTHSSDFPVSTGAYDGGSVNDSSGFIAKLSPDGSRVSYAARVQLDGEIAGLAVDQSGSAFAAGWTRSAIATTPSSVFAGNGIIPSCDDIPCTDAAGSLGVTRAFVFKLTADGAALGYSTYLGDWADSAASSAVAVDPDGNAYIAGSSLWKLNPTADQLLFATSLSGYGFTAAALDARGNLITGGFGGANLFTTKGVWKPWPDAFDGFVARYSPLGELLASTSMGAAVTTVAAEENGAVVAGGRLVGGSYYTMSMMQGPFGADWFASVSSDLSQLEFSSFIGGRSIGRSVRAGAQPGGQLLAAGSYYDGIPYGDPPGADVVLYGGITSSTDNPRIDAVLNEADPSPNPLSPGERIVVWGPGIEQGVGILVGTQEGQIVDVRPGELTAVVPNSLDTTSPAGVFLMVDGKRSALLQMPTAATSPVLYNGDGYASTEALILNEDGTQNSASRPAPRGSVVGFAVNGAGSYTVSGSAVTLANPIEISVAGLPTQGVGAVLMPAPGLKGDVLFIQAKVPDDIDVPAGPVSVPVGISPSRYLSGSRPTTMWVK
jgi:uncharacterized protein (TIGR03437 family)